MGVAVIPVFPSTCLGCSAIPTTDSILCEACHQELAQQCYRLVDPDWHCNREIVAWLRQCAPPELQRRLRALKPEPQQLVAYEVVQYLHRAPGRPGNLLIVEQLGLKYIRTTEGELLGLWQEVLRGTSTLDIDEYYDHPHWIQGLARGDAVAYHAAMDRAWLWIAEQHHPQLVAVGRLLRLKTGHPYNKSTLYRYLQEQTPYTGRLVLKLLPFYATVYRDLLELTRAGQLVLVARTATCDEVVYLKVAAPTPLDPAFLQHWCGALHRLRQAEEDDTNHETEEPVQHFHGETMGLQFGDGAP
jgi:hypothetical protein